MGSRNFERMLTPHNMSHVTCHVSYVMCHRWMACYQQGWPHLVLYIWVEMPGKNNGLFDVLFSQSLWLKCALLCLPGSLELDCSWTTPQCESPQVISLAKFKYLYAFRDLFFLQTLNCHYSSTVRAFDLIPKMRARPDYQLSSGCKYTAWLASAFHPDGNLL